MCKKFGHVNVIYTYTYTSYIPVLGEYKKYSQISFRYHSISSGYSYLNLSGYQLHYLLSLQLHFVIKHQCKFSRGSLEINNGQDHGKFVSIFELWLPD